MLLMHPTISPDLQALLARAMFPDPQRTAHTFQQYHQRTDWQVFAWQIRGKIVCAAGLQAEGHSAEILHIGTDPLHSGQGYGRALLQAVIRELNLMQVRADTDDSSIGFYRKLGFTDTEIPNPWNTRRYRCTLKVSPGGVSSCTGTPLRLGLTLPAPRRRRG